MTRLAWSQSGSRFYETGVDRGVLFVSGQPGVVWNGLRGLNDQPMGGVTKAYYQDGERYVNVSTPSEYASTIEAYTYPQEFEICDGTAVHQLGLFITHQPRRPFGLCYRTKIGNDIQGVDYGYKLHFLYNATAEPSQRNYTSLDESPEPILFQWGVSAVPMVVDGYKSTPHIYIDTNHINEVALNALENIIYGTDITDPRLPLPAEIFDILSSADDFFIVDNGNGSYSASGIDVTLNGDQFTIDRDSVVNNGDGSFTITY